MSKLKTSKLNLSEQIIHLLQAELLTVELAADDARKTATHAESTAENKYDTFGLEAAYLAEGLSRRVSELKLAIQTYQNLNLRDFSELPIGIGALVELENEEGDVLHYFFIGPAGAGLILELSSGNYKVITPASPMGQQLLGKEIGDEVTLMLNGKIVRLEVAAIR